MSSDEKRLVRIANAGEPIGVHDASFVAYLWHSGQWSNLYGFASTGRITDPDNLISEIYHCQIQSENETDRKALGCLRDYVEGRIISRTECECDGYELDCPDCKGTGEIVRTR